MSATNGRHGEPIDDLGVGEGVNGIYAGNKPRCGGVTTRGCIDGVRVPGGVKLCGVGD